MTRSRPRTNEEEVERSRKVLQDAVDRADYSARTPEKLIDSANLPHRVLRFIAGDLTEIGKFDLELPPAYARDRPKVLLDSIRRHWVYRHNDGRVVTLQLSQRTKLRTFGFVDTLCFIEDPRSRN